MTIIFLTHYFPPEVNAPASRTYENAKRWVVAGHRVRVVTCVPNCPDGIVYKGYRNRLFQKEMVDGIEVIRLWTFIAPNKGAFRRILNYLSYMVAAIAVGMFICKPDIMIATSPQFFCGFAGAVIKKIRRFCFVLEIRDIWPESITTVGAMKKGKVIRFLEALEKVMYNSADHVVAVGEGYRENIVAKGVARGKTSVVYNGADVERYVPMTANAAFKDKYHLSGNMIIGYIGTVGMAHGLEVMIRAAQKTRDRDWTWMVVGDGARRENLEQRSNEADLSNLIFTGRLPKEEMPRVWSALDICFIHLRKTDLFTTVIPSKMFEAMAMEKPIIMGVQGEASDILLRSGAGFIIEPENEDMLIQIVKQFADNPSQLEMLGKKGRLFVQEFFNRNALAEQYLTILENQRCEKK
ncbi:MAG: hypothetical protein A2268_13225 [Candidatus Raymondbacteria bacterium RifOxyA12_full_50_37]|uniref:Glycosyltransferase WbuB n=1 Tax=Candidatus Raymondbacteria bacterium RIFOXYD12_FULL_49_13 TaxID=1817890 RepID=A0A1F7F060_UNCRA|nr:MAG: hypothetical protein A2268_13225 [Candidatus Raymondbacteria bacterium RifOxyA12_full_50_37]OGJ93023.1 MAG: hypothetical protein A2248_18360 [Candidatus Raymondbacteria bacterium RIFOXYA2_FULL_49_16]OGJ94856.1 MAG: hypothetical protein A2350_15415 [Candidatus Raymondbacteria bacterium RifOxyB12_full_50_8]OGJ99936.1 MAG: hypothetical protein A2519_00340 [Candidatus Raymondbacteria bacterium RIFOXYD12_FULL_49_13]OGK04127.1 MAG: hypothetical protein A2487_14020 [Candidatus Raymondbacteria 